MSNGNITFDSGNYGAGQGADNAPNPTPPDTPPTPGSPIDAALAVYHAAANGDDPAHDTELGGLHSDRETQYGDNLAKFPASEDKNSAEMAQAFPQIISGIAGAVTGAFGGLVAPLTQIPQAVMQAGQGALQTGMGALQQHDTSGDLTSARDEAMLDDPSLFGDDLSALYGGTGGGGGAGGTEEGGGGGTTGGGTTTDPTSALAPPPMPIGTFPAAAAPPAPSTPAAPTGPTTPMGMGGMPYMPMGGTGANTAGTGAPGEKQPTKKVVPPVIKNSKAVTGRLSGPRLQTSTVRHTGVGSLSSRTAKRQPQETPANDEGKS